MVSGVTVAITSIFFLGGIILGSLLRPKPKCSGRLIIDEKGDTERWSFMLDEPVEEVREKDVIFLKIDRRA